MYPGVSQVRLGICQECYGRTKEGEKTGEVFRDPILYSWFVMVVQGGWGQRKDKKGMKKQMMKMMSMAHCDVSIDESEER